MKRRYDVLPSKYKEKKVRIKEAMKRIQVFEEMLEEQKKYWMRRMKC